MSPFPLRALTFTQASLDVVRYEAAEADQGSAATLAYLTRSAAGSSYLRPSVSTFMVRRY
jgi:hypothetical protein